MIKGYLDKIFKTNPATIFRIFILIEPFHPNYTYNMYDYYSVGTLFFSL